MESRLYYFAAVEVLILVLFAAFQIYHMKRLVLKGRII